MAASTVPYTGPVPTSGDNQHLNCMVLQSLTNYGDYNNTSDNKYVEVWKGPTSEMLNGTWVNNRYTLRVFSVDFVLGQPRPQTSSNTWIRRYPVPVLPSGWLWIVDNIKVRESEKGGIHSYLEITYVGRNSNAWDFNNLITTVEDQSKISWSLDWGSTGQSPLIYASRKAGTFKYVSELNGNKKQGEAAHISDDAAVELKLAVEQYLSGKYKTLSKYQYVYQNKIYEIENTSITGISAACKLYDDMLAGINPISHYPILKKITVQNGKASIWLTLPKMTGTLGNDVDVIQTFPSDCPFSMPSSAQSIEGTWMWLKVADTVTTEKTKTSVSYTRTEIWWGDAYWQESYYGVGHFKKGATQNSNGNGDLTT